MTPDIDLTALVASFTLSTGATAAISAVNQVSGTTANDFSADVAYTITAQDGTTTEQWTVSVISTSSWDRGQQAGDIVYNDGNVGIGIEPNGKTACFR